jgi:hypothetical protein
VPNNVHLNTLKKLGQVFTKRKRPRKKEMKDEEYTIVTNRCATLVYYSREKVRTKAEKKKGHKLSLLNGTMGRI